MSVRLKMGSTPEMGPAPLPPTSRSSRAVRARGLTPSSKARGLTRNYERSEMSSIQFVAPPGDASAGERLQHIAIQATAVMLQSWFEDEEPSPAQASAMVSAVMDALLRPRPEATSGS